MILLCGLCSESYSDVFTKFVNTEEEAKDAIVEQFDGEDAKYRFEDNRCTVDELDEEIEENIWHVFQWFEVIGEYIVLYHHAFDGFDFEVVGEYPTLSKARDAMIMKSFDRYSEYLDDQRDFQWLDHNSACVDTGNEWEHWLIVEAPVEVK